MTNGGKGSKKQSKRQSTKLRVKVEKKVKDHARKLKREKKKNPGKFVRSNKDPGVPNNCPFKDQVSLVPLLTVTVTSTLPYRCSPRPRKWWRRGMPRRRSGGWS